MSRVARVIVLAVGLLGAFVGAWLTVHRAPAPPFDVALQSLLDASVDDGLAPHAVLVIASGDGRIVWAGAAGSAHAGPAPRMRPSTPIRIASITKLYTATVVMRLEEQGLLALDDPMAKYLPHALIDGIAVRDGIDYADRITLRQLLAHRSGIADYYDTPGPDGSSLYQLFLANPACR